MTAIRMSLDDLARHCAEALRRAERHEAERQARALAERLKGSLLTTLRSIGDAVISTDAAANVTFMNPIAEQLTGWSLGEAGGRSLHDVFPIFNEASGAQIESPVDKVLRDGVIVELANHTVLRRRDGGEVPISDSAAPIRDASGAIRGVVLVFRDATSVKRDAVRRRLLLQATEELLEAIDVRQALRRITELVVPELADWAAVDLVDPGTRRCELEAITHVDPDKAVADTEEVIRDVENAPHVTYDFWHQFDAAQALEELRLYRPSIYKALPEAP